LRLILASPSIDVKARRSNFKMKDSGRLIFMFRRALALFLFAISVRFSVAATKPNIILITLESTRSDRMGFLGAKQGITPALDGLARQSIVFEQAYAQAPTTVASHATILTGTYPQTHRSTEFAAPLAATLPYLPDLLRVRGYHTAAFVGTIALDPKNGSAPGFDRGFSVYDANFHPPEPGQPRYNSIERRGAEVVARANAWVDRNLQGPFFLWIQISGPQGSVAAGYNSAVIAADAALGKLLAVLRTRKLFDDALIVITSDHGASLGAHGEDQPGVFLYDETIRVPLLVKLPQNQDAAKRVHNKVPLVNIAPTILEVAGTPIPSQMQGQSLIRIAKGNAAEQPIYSRSDFPAQAFGLSPLESWRAGKFLYIRAPKPELYDLSADPAATHNLAQTSKATLDTMASQLANFGQHFISNGNQQTQLTSSEMQKLASLGYVGIQKPATVNAAINGADPKEVITTINKISAATASLEEGKPERVQVILEPLMGAASGMYLAQYVMGVALAQQQKYLQAIQYLHRAIELQPDSVWAHYRMGEALLKSNDAKTAAVHLEIAAERLPNFAPAHALLAQAYEHMGRADDAKPEKAKAAQQ
jgi:arylsulfatase A-like enzyme